MRARVLLGLSPCSKSVPMISLTAYVLPSITDCTMSQTQPFEIWSHLCYLELADPNPASHLIHLLIGSNLFSLIFLPKSLCLGSTDAPMALKTVFGWIIADSLGIAPGDTNKAHVSLCSTECDTDVLLRKFWEDEEIPQQLPLRKTSNARDISSLLTPARREVDTWCDCLSKQVHH